MLFNTPNRSENRSESFCTTVQPAYKVVRIRGMSAYSVGSSGPDSCVRIVIGIGESRYGFSGYRGGPEPFQISELHCILFGVKPYFDSSSFVTMILRHNTLYYLPVFLYYIF